MEFGALPGINENTDCCPNEFGEWSECCPKHMTPAPTNAPTPTCSNWFTKDVMGLHTEQERESFKDCYTSLRDNKIQDSEDQCLAICIRRNPSNPLQSNTWTQRGASRLRCTVTNCERFALDTIRNNKTPTENDARLLFCLHPIAAKARNIVGKDECLNLFDSPEWEDKGVTQEMYDEWNK